MSLWWPIQHETHGTMAENEGEKIASLQTYWFGLFWAIAHQAKQRKKEDLAVHIHLHYCKSHPPWTYGWQFLLVLKRFVAGWEKPNEIISDNASHFKVAKNNRDLCENVISNVSIHTYLSNEKWSFIRIATMDGRVLQTSHRNHKGVPQEKYW